QIGLVEFIPPSNLAPSRGHVPIQVDSGGENLGSANCSTHPNRVLLQSRINREDLRRPPQIRLFDQLGKLAEGRLWNQPVQLVYQVVHERDAMLPGESDAGRCVEDSEPHEDVRPKFLQLPAN